MRILKRISTISMLCLLFVLVMSPSKAEAVTKSAGASWSNVAVADTGGGNVNVRAKANTSAKVVGKLANHGAAIIKKRVKKSSGVWYYIKSGSVKGYVKADYFKTGSAAKKLAKRYGSTSYRIGVTALRLRAKASTSSKVLVSLKEGKKVKIIKKGIKGKDGYTYAKVSVTVNHKKYKGYLAQKYLTKSYTLKNATSTKSTTTKTSSSSKKSSSSRSSSSAKKTSSSSRSSKGSKIAATAKKYVGRLRYVYGGTSLSRGTDCSGFVQAIYKLYGISIPRTSSAQARSGRRISRSKLRVGDIVCYGSGSRVNHVGIYIGNGKIVHNANSRRDCVIDNMYYMTPVRYVTYLH